MKPMMLRALLVAGLGMATVAAAEPDRKGCTDPALFPVRMPGCFIADCKSAEYDGYDFKLPKGQKQRQEGRFTSGCA